MENKKMNKQTLLSIIYVMVVVLAGVSVAYAALSSTLTVTTNKITQSALTWNVGFQTGTVTPIEGGTSNEGRTCGAATVTASSVTIAQTTLSKPGDSCTYELTIKNTGSIDATLATITPVTPSSTSCTNSGASMVCGSAGHEITYKLTTDSTGDTLLTNGGTLAKSTGTQIVYLVVKYTGSQTGSSDEVHNNGGFTLIYNQK